MTATETTPPEPATQAGTCRECNASLAADQLYCLNCGARCADSRFDGLRERLSPAASAAPAATPSGHGKGVGPASDRGERDYAPLAAVGGVAVLGLMLLVGVLIGRGSDDPTTTAAPAPIVRVPETAAGRPTTAMAPAAPQTSPRRSAAREAPGPASGVAATP